MEMRMTFEEWIATYEKARSGQLAESGRDLRACWNAALDGAIDVLHGTRRGNLQGPRAPSRYIKRVRDLKTPNST